MAKTGKREERGHTIDKRIEQYLKAPYARILMPESDGTFTAEILEFPGCLAQGDTAPEALSNLERAARGWIEAALEQGQEIPAPTTSQGFSGRVALRLPKGLHRQAVRYAQRDGTSLNQFLLTAVASRLGAEDMVEKIALRGLGAKVVHQNVSANVWAQMNVAIVVPSTDMTGTAILTSAPAAWGSTSEATVSLGAKELEQWNSGSTQRGQNRG